MNAKIRLGDLLVRAGVLTPTQLEAALSEQRRWGGRLGRILVQMQFLSESVLVRALSKQMGIRAAELARANVPPELLKKLSPRFLRDNAVCPERYDPQQKVLHLAMADPSNVRVVDEVRFRCGVRVEPCIAGEREIQDTLNRMLGLDQAHQAAAHREVELAQAAPPSTDVPLGQWAKLDGAQRQQEQALRVLVDLLIEKGVFTRSQYLDLLSRR